MQASTSSGALAELLLDLKRLDDFCVANRVIIFNQEDLEQVKSLMASSGRDGGVSGRIDLDEARAFASEAGELLGAALQQAAHQHQQHQADGESALQPNLGAATHAERAESLEAQLERVRTALQQSGGGAGGEAVA